MRMVISVLTHRRPQTGFEYLQRLLGAIDVDYVCVDGGTALRRRRSSIRMSFTRADHWELREQ